MDRRRQIASGSECILSGERATGGNACAGLWIFDRKRDITRERIGYDVCNDWAIGNLDELTYTYRKGAATIQGHSYADCNGVRADIT